MLKQTSSTPKFVQFDFMNQRRKSQERFAPLSTEGFNFPGINQLGSRNSLFTPQNTIMINKDQLQQIREKSSMDINPEKLRKLQEKEELHQISQQRISNWPNTIHAIRKKKDDARYQKFLDQELKRQEVDREEYEFQQQKRQRVIEKANQQIYEGQDRIRAFQGKMLLSDAIQERDEQVKLKNQIKEVEKIRNSILDENQKLLKEVEEEEYKNRIKIRKEKTQETAKILKDQHGDIKANFIKKVQQEKIEGEIQKIKAIDAFEKELEQKRFRKHKILQLQEEIKEGDKEVQRQKELEKLKQQEEDLKIEFWKQNKEKIQNMRQIRESQKLTEKNAIKQKLLDSQSQQILERQVDEEKRLELQIKEAQIKAEKEILRKKQYREQQLQKIQISTKQTLEKKARDLVKEKTDNQEFQTFCIKKNEKIVNLEQGEKRENFDRYKSLQEYHVQQIEEKQKLREDQFLHELQEEQRIKQLYENEDNNFKTWASMAINEWKNDGKTIYPMLHELKEYKKKTWQN